MNIEGFVPTHRVRLYAGTPLEVIREDYVVLRGSNNPSIHYGHIPGIEDAVYAVISSGKWQCLDQHGLVREEVVRYIPDYIPQSECDGVVYFAQSGDQGPIKIGWSQDVERRILELQTANAHRLHLLGTIPGRLEDEMKTHARFAHLRMEGEWFRNDPEIHTYLSQAGEAPIR